MSTRILFLLSYLKGSFDLRVLVHLSDTKNLYLKETQQSTPETAVQSLGLAALCLHLTARARQCISYKDLFC